MTRIHRVAQVALLAVSFAVPAAAQQGTAVTQADIQRLQDTVYLVDRDLTQLRGRDSVRAGDLSNELDELRDEVVYLKVKLRKERTLGRSEYLDVRDRLENMRTRARAEGSGTLSSTGSSTSQQAGGFGTARDRDQAQTSSQTGTRSTQTGQTSTRSTTSTRAGAMEIPAGTEIDVRLSTGLNSGTAQAEQRFEGTTMTELTVDGRTVAPAGSVMRGVVTAVEPGTRTNRTARMTVAFDQITIGGRDYPLRGTVTQALEGEGIRGEAGRAGAGAAVGGVIGAVLGGVKGAVLGAMIGGGGTIAATEGKEVDLPQGTVLRVRVDSPVQVR